LSLTNIHTRKENYYNGAHWLEFNPCSPSIDRHRQPANHSFIHPSTRNSWVIDCSCTSVRETWVRRKLLSSSSGFNLSYSGDNHALPWCVIICYVFCPSSFVGICSVSLVVPGGVTDRVHSVRQQQIDVSVFTCVNTAARPHCVHNQLPFIHRNSFRHCSPVQRLESAWIQPMVLSGRCYYILFTFPGVKQLFVCRLRLSQKLTTRVAGIVHRW
jgi:hypothetical protein